MSIVRIIWRIPLEVLAIFETHLKVVPPFKTGVQLKNGGTLLECKQGNILCYLKSLNLLYVMVLFTILENKGLILINTTLSNKSLVLHIICYFI